MKVSFHNVNLEIEVAENAPLDASIEQVMDIFLHLPEDDGSFLTLINNDNIHTRFSKYNKFVWLVEIPVPMRKGIYQIFLTKRRCFILIEDIFNGVDPLSINGLMFEKNLG